MRLNRLDLIRYGRFKDAVIDCPRHDDGTPDVTVVFGPNEAGKSTAFRGFLELLFGFRAGAHPHAFRFARSDLLVGAELELPGLGATVLRRNSKPSQSLLDMQDRPVNEAILASALHGLTRDAYEERFSLDEKGLREGGARIAAAQGDLGQLLHAGVSGLTGMAQTLDALSARADRFHRKRARGTVLKAGADRLKDIGRDLRAARLTTERERILRHERDRADAAFEAADAGLRQAHHRQAAAEAAQTWHDRTDEIVRLERTLQDLPDGPDLPPGAPERVAGLVERSDGLESRIAEARVEIASLDDVIARNPADPLVDALAAELKRLDEFTIDGAPLMGRAMTARVDLDRRIQRQAEIAVQMNDVLADLSDAHVPASALALAPPALEALASAAQDCVTADLAAMAAREAVDTARAQQRDPPKEPRDLSALRAALGEWQNVADPSALETARDQATARLTKATAGLPETWRDLIGAGLPARETLDEAARIWATLTADLASARKAVDACAAELSAARTERAAQETAREAVDVAMTEQTRRQRDMAWHYHRERLTAETADRFETAMLEDDDTRAHYLTGAEARQRLLNAQGQARAAQARYDTAKAHHDDLVADRKCVAERCAALARALGLSQDTAPTAFAARHEALTSAADAAADLANAHKALETQTARRHSARDALANAARSVGLDPARGDLPALAQQAVTLEDNDRKLWARWQDAEKAIAALETKSALSRTACETARRTLDGLTAALPLQDRSPDGIRTALPRLRSLSRLHAEHQTLSTRIEALEQAIATLTEGAQRLARIMDTPEDTAHADPLATVDRARARLVAAVKADDARREATTRRDDAALAKSRAQADLQTAQNGLADCLDGQGWAELAPRDRVARLAERDRLRADRAVADRARATARNGVDAELFSEELDRLPDASRAAELQQALEDAQVTRDAARDAQRDAARLYGDAFAAADRSDLATEQATLLEELRNGARQAAVARLGVLAAQGALRRLAAERRSTMLRDVEDAFVTMTAPAWTGVDVWSQAEGEKLVGVQRGGGTVPVEQMSTGTMGQLYFALRLAGYRSFARAPGPLPMILDDIMETFDDTRAQAALRLCAEIGANGQAILFTHHAHLVALARDCIPGIAIVDMPD